LLIFRELAAFSASTVALRGMSSSPAAVHNRASFLQAAVAGWGTLTW